MPHKGPAADALAEEELVEKTPPPSETSLGKKAVKIHPHGHDESIFGSPRLLLKVTTMSDDYIQLKKNSFRLDKERNNPTERYVDRFFKNLPRDVPPGPDRSEWLRNGENGEKGDDPNQYVQGKPSYGKHQSYMMYYQEELLSNGASEYSIFNTENLSWSKNIELPVCGQSKVRCPVNVRPSDGYLVAAYLDLPKANLPRIFPADVARDGYPFTDRPQSGVAARPRAHIQDFPLPGGTMGYDTRIAFIQCGEGGDVYFFGGSGFRVEDISDEDWCNLHHKYIDITNRIRRDLVSAFQEPVEVDRRKSLPAAQLYQPDGAESVFDKSLATLQDIVASHQSMVDSDQNEEDEPPELLTRKDRATVLSNHPTRGHHADIPTFELIAHVAAASATYTAAATNYATDIDQHLEASTGLVATLDLLVNRVAEWNQNHANELTKWLKKSGSDTAETESNPTAMINIIGNGIMNLQRSVNWHFSRLHTLNDELKAVIQDIPEPHNMLKNLPTSVFTEGQRELVDTIYSAVQLTGPNSRTRTHLLHVDRTSVDEVVDATVDNPEWYLGPANVKAYAKPFLQGNNENPSHDLLQMALTTPVPFVKVTNVKSTQSTQSVKRELDNLEESPAARAKRVRLSKRPGSSSSSAANTPLMGNTKARVGSTPRNSKDSSASKKGKKSAKWEWIWPDTLNGKTRQAHLRAGMSALVGVTRMKGMNAPEMIAFMEDKVNKDDALKKGEAMKWGQLASK